MRATGFFMHAVCVLIAANSLALNAAPAIEVDRTTYECGVVTEGVSEFAAALYNVRNSGDSLLKIESVRPGCGCVVAAYDTFIKPGESGKIRVKARLHGYQGDLRKSVTLSSNAMNQPVIRLVLHATIQPAISVSKQQISFLPSLENIKDSLFMASSKKDLKVTGISFKSFGKTNPTWIDQTPISIGYEWSHTDSISPEGFSVFKLTIKRPNLKETISGEFILSTNHPDKKQLEISANIENQL